MNRKKAMIVWAKIVGLAALGLFLSRGVTAGQLARQSNQKAKTAAARPGMPQNYLTVMGSQINIPPCAFSPSGPNEQYETGYKYNYIRGDAIGTAFAAPVIFPKGARSILRVDFWAFDQAPNGHEVELQMCGCEPQSTGPVCNTLFDFFSSKSSGPAQYTLSPPQGTVWPISPSSFYYLRLILSGGALYGAIVYYQ